MKNGMLNGMPFGNQTWLGRKLLINTRGFNWKNNCEWWIYYVAIIRLNIYVPEYGME